jgi:hypothetical protein
MVAGTAVRSARAPEHALFALLPVLLTICC